MTEEPRARADSTIGIELRHEDSTSATALSAEPPNVSKLVQTLAAHGGGAISADLALDLVLNDLVEQARNATGATGAAIALFREGELVCRASTGENAPDLGVRVDANSGLAGACVSTGEMQQCPDTDTDPRVNAEVCRRLGVRSMLIAPLVDGQRAIGIIQVFSAWPNAFGKREISALQVLAGRIAESSREAEIGMLAPAVNAETPSAPVDVMPEPVQQAAQEQDKVEEIRPNPEPRRGIDVWGAVLVILVIAAALALGLVIGWRRAAERTKRSPQVRTNVHAAAGQTPEASAPQNATPVQVGNGLSINQDAPLNKPHPTTPPVGGLLVTQNGKVIYRSPVSAQSAGAHEKDERLLIHKVDPEYPAEAKARRIHGPVVLDVQVLGDGAVGAIAVVSGDPSLTPAAIDAVKRWRYQPEPPDSQGIERRTRITVDFKLPKN